MEEIQEKLLVFVDRIKQMKGQINNEESTKQCLILPFLDILGYDTRNPLEVIPEFVSDMVSKKERVDYCVFRDSQPLFFIEAKPYQDDIEKTDAQLARYFNATPSVKIALLTDGVYYRAFTDLIHPNIMDNEPFYTFNIEELNPKDVFFIRKLSKFSFNKKQLYDFACAQREEKKLDRSFSPGVKPRRRGRPKTKNSVRIHISVEQNLFYKLDNFWLEQGLSPSEFFCELADKYLNEFQKAQQKRA